MHSVRKAPSLTYYLNEFSGEHLHPDERDHVFTDNIEDYYKSNIDFPMIWAGGLSKNLGLPERSIVKSSDLIALWHGIDPKDGKTPLVFNGPTLLAQQKVKESIKQTDDKLHRAKMKLSKFRSEQIKKGESLKEVEKFPEYIKYKKEIDKANFELSNLKKNKAYRQEAHDNVFTAPKGVSILWSQLKVDSEHGDSSAKDLMKAIEEAMLQSTISVINEVMEPMLLYTRQRIEQKEVLYEHVKGISAALTIHTTARATWGAINNEENEPTTGLRKPDPDLHVHALVMALGLDHSDEVRTLWTHFLGSHSKVLGAAFRAELAQKLRDLNIELIQDQQEKVHSFDLVGVSEKVKSIFSNRSEQIRENKNKGLSDQEAKLSGRISKEDFPPEELYNDWSQRLKSCGIHKDQIIKATVKKRAREIAEQNLEELQLVGAIPFQKNTSNWNALLDKEAMKIEQKLSGEAMSVDAAVEHLLSMESAFDMTNILQLAFENAQFVSKQSLDKQTPIQWAQKFTSDILKHPDIQIITETDRYGRPMFTSQGLVKKEKNLYFNIIPNLLQKNRAGLTDEAIKTAIHSMEEQETKARESTFFLKDFQRDLVTDMLKSQRSIHVAIAPAGCGKTTSVAAAVMAWEKEGHRIIALAPSNKAAQNLAKDLKKTRNEGLSAQKLLSLIAQRKIELTNKDVLIVDEASMLDFETANDLLLAVSNAKNGSAKIILMGDTEQLPSVGRGNFFKAIVESPAFSDDKTSGKPLSMVSSTIADWNRITRQKNDLGKLATTFFAQGHNGKALEIYERFGALKMSATRSDCIQQMVSDAYLPLAGLADDLAQKKAEFRSALSQCPQTWHGLIRSDSEELDRSRDMANMTPDEKARFNNLLRLKHELKKCRNDIAQAHTETVMIASKNDDVSALNHQAREILKTIGALGGFDGKNSMLIPRGKIGMMEICEGERLMFSKAIDERKATFSKKGDIAAKTTIGTVIGLSRNARGVPQLLLEIDGPEKSKVLIDTARFNDLNYCYAITAHKSQGISVSKILEFTSEFTSTQTDYVTKSRHRDRHTIYTVESVYKVFKEKSKESIQKIDAKDLNFAIQYFGLTQDQIEQLEAKNDYSKRGLQDLHQKVMKNRQKEIIQGTITDFGEASLDASDSEKKTFFMKMNISGKIFTFWGDSFKEKIKNFKINDYVGIESTILNNKLDQFIQWNVYGEEELKKNELFCDEGTLKEQAAMLASKRQTEKCSISNFSSDHLTKEMKESINLNFLKASKLLKAQMINEKNILFEINNKAELPEDTNERIKVASSVLYLSKNGANEKITQALKQGIEISPYKNCLNYADREWLAIDHKLIYCMTKWGKIEAWSSENIDAMAIREAETNGGTIEKLQSRKNEIHLNLRKNWIQRVQDAFDKYRNDLDIELVESSKHGLSLGIKIREGHAHEHQPELIKLFVNNGKWGDTPAEKKGGIAGLPSCKGFDRDLGYWIFPIITNSKGKITEKQDFIQSLIDLGRDIGTEKEIKDEWKEKRLEVWESIKFKLIHTYWGKLYCNANSVLRKESIQPKLLVNQVFEGKENDIVRWNDKVLENAKDDTQEWLLCDCQDNKGVALLNNERFLNGIVLHSDKENVYLVRGQRIIAIEKKILGLENEKDYSGQEISIKFMNGLPKLDEIKENILLKKAKMLEEKIQNKEFDEIDIKSERFPDLFKTILDMNFKHPLSLNAKNLSELITSTSYEYADYMNLINIRSEGMSISDFVKPIEMYKESKKMDEAYILNIGKNGVLIKHKEQIWIASFAEMHQVLGRNLRPSVTLTLFFDENKEGKTKLDAMLTHQAIEKNRVNHER